MAPPEKRHGPKIPLFASKPGLPSRGSIAWYAGLGAMTALEVIEWPVALIVATSHAISVHARKPAARELGDGAQAGG